MHTFDFKCGDTVLKRDKKNEARVGGKWDVKWLGPYKIVDIDENRRIKLMNIANQVVLKARCHWDQLKPIFTSELHKAEVTDVVDLVSNFDIIPVDSNESKKNYIDQPEDIPDSKRQKLDTSFPETIVVDDNSPDSPPPKTPSSSLLEICNTRFWMTSDHIEVMSNMMKSLSENISNGGLADPCLFEESVLFMVKRVQIDAPFIQILHKGGNHWIAVFNIELEPNVINVYDPKKQLGYTLKDTLLLQKQICSLLNTRSDHIYIRFPDVKQQTDGNSCGFFCVAYCSSLILGDDPREQDYTDSELRSHTAKCITDGYITKYPVHSSKRGHKGYLEETVIYLCQLCKYPHNENMITCTHCYNKFHLHCIKYSYFSAGMFLSSLNKKSFNLVFTISYNFKFSIFN